MELILASSSPRRILLFYRLGIPFRVIPPTYEVRILEGDPIDIAQLTALEKARSVARLLTKGIVVAADTIVFMENKIFMKPRTPQEAKEFLSELSGKTHSVVTGIAIIDAKTNREVFDYEITKVTFRKLDPEEIDAYVSSGEPLDKAGAYGIQGAASFFIERIDGDFWNVIGFPLRLFYELMKNYFDWDWRGVLSRRINFL